jgi:hypothetical protein
MPFGIKVNIFIKIGQKTKRLRQNLEQQEWNQSISRRNANFPRFNIYGSKQEVENRK